MFRKLSVNESGRELVDSFTLLAPIRSKIEEQRSAQVLLQRDGEPTGVGDADI